MKWWNWVVRFVVSYVVLFVLGYIVPGFSALSMGWIAWLSLLIMVLDGVLDQLMSPEGKAGITGSMMTFVIATLITYVGTMQLQYGRVPFWGALVAGAIIGVIVNLVSRTEQKLEQQPEGQH